MEQNLHVSKLTLPKSYLQFLTVTRLENIEVTPTMKANMQVSEVVLAKLFEKDFHAANIEIKAHSFAF